ncbi:MAG: hypothetical protein E4G92_01170 [Bacteroidia bacterium]|nr:MAG: hypothetical protein E4G92_01170 [Bacteroidia bacterium]
MKIRKELSVLLLLLSLVLALLPISANRSFNTNPDKLLSDVLTKDLSFTADQVAEFVVREDSTIQMIDLRPSEEFRRQSIPGAVSILMLNLLIKILRSGSAIKTSGTFSMQRGVWRRILPWYMPGDWVMPTVM